MPSQNTNLTIIIVTYNSEAIIHNCLSNISPENNEVFVVDNNSSDTTVKIIADNFKTVKIIKNPTNLGFGRANNIALSQTKNNFALILNVDAQISPDDIKKTIEIMSQNPDIAIAGGVVHNCVIENNKIILLKILVLLSKNQQILILFSIFIQPSSIYNAFD